MHKMTRPRPYARAQYPLGAYCLALCIALSQGCARSEPLRPVDANPPASSKQELPFHPDTEQGAGEYAGPAVPADAKSAGGPVGTLPFKASPQGRVVPAGTLLTVQLRGALSTARVHAGDAFTAVIAAPLAIDGETLIPGGAAVTGRVESEQSQRGLPGLIPGSGYFRLTLSTISIDGKQIDLQTSSLFAKGTVRPSNLSAGGSASSPQLENVRVRKGHTLTFRLTAPLMLDMNTTAKEQHPQGAN